MKNKHQLNSLLKFRQKESVSKICLNLSTQILCLRNERYNYKITDFNGLKQIVLPIPKPKNKTIW